MPGLLQGVKMAELSAMDRVPHAAMMLVCEPQGPCSPGATVLPPAVAGEGAVRCNRL